MNQRAKVIVGVSVVAIALAIAGVVMSSRSQSGMFGLVKHDAEAIAVEFADGSLSRPLNSVGRVLRDAEILEERNGYRILVGQPEYLGPVVVGESTERWIEVIGPDDRQSIGTNIRSDLGAGGGATRPGRTILLTVDDTADLARVFTSAGTTDVAVLVDPVSKLRFVVGIAPTSEELFGIQILDASGDLISAHSAVV